MLGASADASKCCRRLPRQRGGALRCGLHACCARHHFIQLLWLVCPVHHAMEYTLLQAHVWRRSKNGCGSAPAHCAPPEPQASFQGHLPRLQRLASLPINQFQQRALRAGRGHWGRAAAAAAAARHGGGGCGRAARGRHACRSAPARVLLSAAPG